jgi:hypothetical protein
VTTPYQERPRKGGGNEASLDGGKTWRKLLPCAMTASNAQKVHAGTKGQTRRLLNPQPVSVARLGNYAWTHGEVGSKILTPRYHVGDVLWIQEPWRTLRCWNYAKPTSLEDTGSISYEGEPGKHFDGKLRPGRFLPLRFARPARYEVTAVRLERVNEISEADAQKEGVQDWFSMSGDCEDQGKWIDYPTSARDKVDGYHRTAKASFGSMWNSIHDAPGTRFEDAPWVFAYPFGRVR